MTNNTTELLPCPFCGSEMEAWGVNYRHTANDCLFFSQTIYPSDFAKWNRRSAAHGEPKDGSAEQVSERGSSLPKPDVYLAWSDDGENIRFWTRNTGHAAEWANENWPTEAYYSADQMKAAIQSAPERKALSDDDILRIFYKEIDGEGFALYEVTPGNMIAFARALLAQASAQSTDAGSVSKSEPEIDMSEAPQFIFNGDELISFLWHIYAFARIYDAIAGVTPEEPDPMQDPSAQDELLQTWRDELQSLPVREDGTVQYEQDVWLVNVGSTQEAKP